MAQAFASAWSVSKNRPTSGPAQVPENGAAASWLALEASPWLVARKPWAALAGSAVLGPACLFCVRVVPSLIPPLSGSVGLFILAGLSALVTIIYAWTAPSAPRRIAPATFLWLLAALVVAGGMRGLTVRHGAVEMLASGAATVWIAAACIGAGFLIPRIVRMPAGPASVPCLAAVLVLACLGLLGADAMTALSIVPRVAIGCAVLALAGFAGTVVTAAWPVAAPAPATAAAAR